MIEEFIDRWVRGGRREAGVEPSPRDIREAAGIFPYAAPIDYILQLMLAPEGTEPEERESAAGA